MNCPVCGLQPELVSISTLGDFDQVIRYCNRCEVRWIFRHSHIHKLIISVVQEGQDMGEYGAFGFDYTCPKCGISSYVATVYKTSNGWKCIKCGNVVTNENIRPRGNFQLESIRGIGVSSTRRRGTKSASTYQRTPRTSKPIPVGAVALAQVAEKLNVESKKLRSWLRKSNWRPSEEARSQWIFSPEEAEEIIKNFKK